MEITMNDKWISKSNGNDNGNGNDTIPPLFEVIKEEKAVSSEEQEEDDFHQDLNQQQHQHTQSNSNSNSNSQPNQQQHISQSQCQLQSKSQSQWQQKEHNTTKINAINDDSINDNNDNGNDEEENEIHELRKRLESIRIQRRRIHESKYKECMKQQDRLLERLNIRRRDRNEIIHEYSSAWKGRDSVCLFLDCAKRWNVVNDCFYIWIDGRNGFATINGCRLGGEAFPLPSELLVSARRQQQQQQQQQQDDNNNNSNNNNNQASSRSEWVPTAASISTTEINGKNNNNVDSSSLSSQQHQHKQLPPRRRLLGFFSGGNNDTTNASTALPFQRKVSSMISTPQQPIHVRVPWLEVNAALGHACLLLRILQESSSKNGGIGMKFTHELYPMGATSKIGIRFGKSVTASAANGVLAAAAGFGSIYNATTTTSSPYVQPVVYNLFFEESSGFNSFFKNNFRNFNWALQAFLQCIAEAAAQQKDKTIAIPHVIRHYKQSSTTNKNNTDTTNNNNNNNNSIGINDLNGGEWTIGGLSICYPSQQQVAAAVGNNNNSNNYHQGSGNNNGMTTTSSIALDWTRACRYLLTDLKWLIAYAAKHVDR
jgi:hypothetical protein